MSNQELLEAIAPYLPYGLKWSLQDLKIFTMSGITKETLFTEEGTVLNWNISDSLPQALFPILRPLSDLTKPCLEGGKVPIVELAKIVSNEKGWLLEDEVAIKYINLSNYYIFCFCQNHICFNYEIWHDEECLVPDKKFNQKLVFDQLYKWNFWIGDQNEFGKSIVDINTIKL